MNSEITSQKKSLFSLYLSTVGGLVLVLSAVWLSASMLPHSKAVRQFFLAENNLLEMLALSLLSAALILTVYTLVSAQKTRPYAPYWWFFPLGILLLICDETSFGRVYYDWYAPLKICGGKFDALHDLLIVLPHCLPQLGISKLVFCLGVFVFLIIVLIATGLFFLRHKSALFSSFQTHPVWLYLALAFILFGLEAA